MDVSDEGVTLLDAAFPEDLDLSPDAQPEAVPVAPRSFLTRDKELPATLRHLPSAASKSSARPSRIPRRCSACSTFQMIICTPEIRSWNCTNVPRVRRTPLNCLAAPLAGATVARSRNNAGQTERNRTD